MSNHKTKPEKSPAYQWYPKDVLTSARVAELSLAEEGAYRRALDFCWLNGDLPGTPQALAKIIGKGCTTKIAAQVAKLFEEKDGRLQHERLNIERQKQADFKQKQSESGKKGNQKRWGAGHQPSLEASQADSEAIAEQSQGDEKTVAKNRSSSSSSTPVISTTNVVDKKGDDDESPMAFHTQWMNRLMDTAEAYTREQIQVQTKVEVSREILLAFNAHLHTDGKFHAHYREYIRHFTSWLPIRHSISKQQNGYKFNNQQQGVTLVSKPKFAN